MIYELLDKTYPPWLQKIYNIFKITNKHNKIKIIQLAYSTELKNYLPNELKKYNILPDKYIGENTYSIIEITNTLSQLDLNNFKSNCLKYLDSSIVDNLFYIFNTHYNHIFKASAIIVLWLLAAYAINNQ